MGRVDTYCDDAVAIALDPSHGYSQPHRDGPDYDCSSLVIKVLEDAGYPVKKHGASYTGNMLTALTACGFTAMRYAGLANLRRGDILLNERVHTAICISPQRLVEACGSETGGIDGQTGDQTGNEIRVCSVYEPTGWSWEWVLRPPEADDPDPVRFWVQYGTVGRQAIAVEAALNYYGYGWLSLDARIDLKDAGAIRQYQHDNNLEVDGIVGPETFRKLFEE